MISYLALLDVCKQINDNDRFKKQQRNVSVIQDIDGNNIGDDLPSEYSGSKYTHSIKGTNAKAKANAVQGIPEMIEIAVGKHFRENKESKHWRNAMYGWYRYDSRFAIPVYRDDEEVERYNIFHASLIVRYSEDGKLYLYDVIDIKKEMGFLSCTALRLNRVARFFFIFLTSYKYIFPNYSFYWLYYSLIFFVLIYRNISCQVLTNLVSG